MYIVNKNNTNNNNIFLFIYIFFINDYLKNMNVKRITFVLNYYLDELLLELE